MIVSDERHTPKPLIDAVIDTMGSIDCDPASNDLAQKTVKAYRYYTEDDNGLDYSWDGNVFLNAPYSRGKHVLFAEKLIREIDLGHVKQAIIITPSDSSPKWFKMFDSVASAICLTPRLEFQNPYAKSSSNNATNFIFYVGDNVESFKNNFSFGAVYVSK